MKKRDLLFTGLLLCAVSVSAQPGVTEPVRYSDDAHQIFMQDFEDDAEWQEILLNEDPQRPTTLYTWQEDPVDFIEEVTYYKRQSGDSRTDSVADLSSSSIGSGTNIYDGSSQWEIAGVRDTFMALYNGVMRTDAKWPEDSILGYDTHNILKHTAATQSGTGAGPDGTSGKEYGLDRFGEDGGTKYFTYSSADGNGVSNYTSDGKYVPEYRRNLFVRLNEGDIEDYSSYRVTVFVKSTKLSEEATPRIGLQLMRGYFHSEKNFMVDNVGYMGKNSWGQDARIYPEFDDKMNYVLEEPGKWQKITLMAYYNNDEVGNASPYLLSYYWLNDWAWQVKANKADTTVNEEDGDTTLIFRAIQQPAKYFVRLSFRGDSTRYDVDNLSLTKSWIAGVEHYRDMIRVDFGYETTLNKKAEEAMKINKIATVEVPGEYFEVWGSYDGEWEQIPILSAEYQGDGFMYMWSKPDADDGSPVYFDEYDDILVTFRNPVDRPDLVLNYSGTRYPTGMDTVWIKQGKPVYDFHNEISMLNPTIAISPVTGKAVKSLKNLAPVLQYEAYEDGTFGLDPKMRTMKMKFSRPLSYDNAGASTELTQVTLVNSKGTEYWKITSSDEQGYTTIERPSNYTADLDGDYVMYFKQVTHLAHPDAMNEGDYGDDRAFNYHFGSFNQNAQPLPQSDWRSEITETKAWDRPCPPSLWAYDIEDGFFQGTGVNMNPYKKVGLYKMKDDGKNGDALFYLSARDNNNKGNLYTTETLKAGSYVLSFPAFGWARNTLETKIYVYSKPSEMTYDNLSLADKTQIGSIKPSYQTSWSGNADEHEWNSQVQIYSIPFEVPADGTYVIEWEINKNGSQNYYGIALGNYKISDPNAGVPFNPVANLNYALAQAKNRFDAANKAQYKSAAFDAFVTAKTEAEGYIAKTIAAGKGNFPSKYDSVIAHLNAASILVKERMDTVDIFDNSLKTATDKLTELAGGVYAGVEAYTALKGVKDGFSGYKYSEKTSKAIAEDAKSLDDAVKALDDRLALIALFSQVKGDVKNYADTTSIDKTTDEFKALAKVLEDAAKFDSIGVSDAELNAEIAALLDSKDYVIAKPYLVNFAPKRIQKLDELAKSLNASYLGDATIAQRIANIDFDDDELAEIMKTAIRVAIYDKIAKDQEVKNLDLTPFIKNFHLYATPRLNNPNGPQTKDDGNTLKNAKIEIPGAQIQNIEHRWNTNKLWCIILDKEFDNLYPGWTVKADNNGGSGNRYVTPGDDDYANFKNGIPAFDGMLAMDWNSKAELKQEVTGLPAGVYTLGVELITNGNSNTSLEAVADGKSYKKTFGTGDSIAATVGKIAVESEKMSIDFILASGNNWSKADDFTLVLNSKSATFDYAAGLANAQAKLDNLITVVDASKAIADGVEYFTVGGMKTAPEAGKILIRKTTKSNGKIVVDKVLIK